MDPIRFNRLGRLEKWLNRRFRLAIEAGDGVRARRLASLIYRVDAKMSEGCLNLSSVMPFR